MKIKKNLRRSSQSGFTLIELLVVVLIIGILVAIAIPQYFKVAERSRLADAFNFFSTLNQSEQRYAAKNTNYMTTAIASIGVNMDVSFNGATPGYGLQNFTVTGLANTAFGAACPNGGFAVTLTRNAGGPAAYGAYQVGFDSCGAPQIWITSCKGAAVAWNTASVCSTDLL